MFDLKSQVYCHPSSGDRVKVEYTNKIVDGEQMIKIHEPAGDDWELLTEIPVNTLFDFLEPTKSKEDKV